MGAGPNSHTILRLLQVLAWNYLVYQPNLQGILGSDGFPGQDHGPRPAQPYRAWQQ